MVANSCNMCISASINSLLASLFNYSTNPSHKIITYLNCMKSASALCMSVVEVGVLFLPKYLILAPNTFAASPLTHFTTAFDEHKKTSACKQQLTDGSEHDSDHVCFDADPGIHVLLPFMFWTPPFDTTKEG